MHGQLSSDRFWPVFSLPHDLLNKGKVLTTHLRIGTRKFLEMSKLEIFGLL